MDNCTALHNAIAAFDAFICCDLGPQLGLCTQARLEVTLSFENPTHSPLVDISDQVEKMCKINILGFDRLDATHINGKYELKLFLSRRINFDT